MNRSSGDSESALARLLVVEDEPDMRRTLARILRGWNVDFAVGALAGLSAIASFPYDVVLCDYRMPYVSGEELYQAVCDARPRLSSRFIFMSGGVATPQAEAFWAGLPWRARLDKPFSPEELFDRVRACLDTSVARPAADCA